jgi:hypothetical protein
MCEGRREMARQVGGELGDTEKPRKQWVGDLLEESV